MVKAWGKLFNLGDDVIPQALRRDPNFLGKFDDIAKNNNLGLDADGIADLLKSPTLKTNPSKWDNVEGVLDGLKRASDSRIPGLEVQHKKFPTPAEGKSPFVLKNAKQYQAEACRCVSGGDANLSFEKGGRSFDDIGADGSLIDRKYGHGKSVFNLDGSVKNQIRANKILQLGEAQVRAANGTPVKWEVSTELGADGIQELFDNAGIDIEVVHVMQQTIINLE